MDVEGDEHATVGGEMLAWLRQVKIDADDVKAKNDRWLDSLEDDENVEEVTA